MEDKKVSFLGVIPKNWKICEFQEVAELKHGYQFRTNDFVEEGVKVFKITQINKDGSINISNCDYISEERQMNFEKFVIGKDDILMALTGATIGKIARYKSNEIILQNYRVGNFVPKDPNTLDKNYFYYFLSSRMFFNQILARQTQSAQQNIGKEEINRMSVLIPPLQEQLIISNILGSLDNKIHLNQKANKVLEQMAQALFKSWFVDFDPVIDNALAAGNDIPEALQHKVEQRKQAQQLPDFKRLPEHIRALFPSEFEQTDEPTVGFDGWIPKGWSAGNLSSLANFTSSRIDGTELTLDNYISTDNMLSNKGGISTASKVPDIKTTPSFKPGDILISNIRPYFQKIWFATFSGGRSNDVLGFEAKNEQCKEYLLNLLYQDVFFDYMMTTSKGSKMPRGDKKAIMDWPVVIPPSSLQKFFSEHVKNYYQVIPIRNKESEALSKLRDTLLPKLISGELSLENNC